MPQILPFHHFGAMLLITILGLTGLIGMQYDMNKKTLPTWMIYLYYTAMGVLAFDVLSGVYLLIQGKKQLLWHYITGGLVVAGFIAFHLWYHAKKTGLRMFIGAWMVMLLAAVAYMLGLNDRM